MSSRFKIILSSCYLSTTVKECIRHMQTVWYSTTIANNKLQSGLESQQLVASSGKLLHQPVGVLEVRNFLLLLLNHVHNSRLRMITCNTHVCLAPVHVSTLHKILTWVIHLRHLLGRIVVKWWHHGWLGITHRWLEALWHLLRGIIHHGRGHRVLLLLLLELLLLLQQLLLKLLDCDPTFMSCRRFHYRVFMLLFLEILLLLLLLMLLLLLLESLQLEFQRCDLFLVLNVHKINAPLVWRYLLGSLLNCRCVRSLLTSNLNK
jgi:hypothetical protein